MSRNIIGRGAVPVLVLAAIFATGAAQAQNVEAGKQIAERWCSSCHRVDTRAQTTANDAVPSFVSVAQMNTTTRMSLAAFLVTPHPSMPNYVLTRREIADVSAYILSLKKPQ